MRALLIPPQASVFDHAIHDDDKQQSADNQNVKQWHFRPPGG
jgi:hypothetical protein